MVASVNRTDRMRALSSEKSIIARLDTDGQLQPGEAKIGYTYDNIVVGPNGIFGNRNDPTAPGFSFEESGSVLRTGPVMRTTAPFNKILFNNGQERLNPLGSVKASSSTDPLPTIVPVLPSSADWLLNSTGQEAMAIFKLLSGG